MIFDQKPEKVEINVGAIILSPGLEPFDPKIRAAYHYGEFQNVVTALDYERLLCATGPYEGEILRASDKKHPPQDRLDPLRRVQTGDAGR